MLSSRVCASAMALTLGCFVDAKTLIGQNVSYVWRRDTGGWNIELLSTNLLV